MNASNKPSDNISARFALIAACMMHVEGFYSTKSLAYRNRNPGNLEHADGVMRVYPTITDGFRALLQDIAANAGRQLGAFLVKYAPPSENDSAMYVHTVSVLSGIPATEPI
jgi:ABC-type sugar transport system substrate-binding protein